MLAGPETKRKIFLKILEKRGFNIADFPAEKPMGVMELAQQGATPMPTPSGGGVSAPSPQGQPATTTQAPQTL